MKRAKTGLAWAIMFLFITLLALAACYVDGVSALIYIVTAFAIASLIAYALTWAICYLWGDL